MHYKNGREAKIGDQVVGKDCNGKAIGGILIEVHPTAEYCDGNVVPNSIIEQSQRVVTLKDCLHIEDFILKTL